MRSLEAEAMRLPEGAAATASTASLWPTNRYARSWSLKFHTMTQPSWPPEMSCFMFGLKQTEEMASLWPRKERSRPGSTGDAMATMREVGGQWWGAEGGASLRVRQRRQQQQAAQRRRLWTHNHG